MATILTLDLGTTYLKAAIFDESGRLVALERAAPPIVHPMPDRWELSPEAFRETIARAIHGLSNAGTGGLRDVSAVSFATQTNSFVLLGEGDRPLTPLILWPDRRAADRDADVRRLSEAPGFYESTGIPSLAAEFMAAKLLWLRTHEADAWSRVRRLCLISDYLTLWWTGRHVTEAGAAGLTGLIDIHGLIPKPEVCGALGLDAAWLPAAVRAGTDLGPIRPGVARELGLPADCRFVVGCLDQYAGAVGAGNVVPDGVSETTGTVLATVRCSRGFGRGPRPGVFQGPAFDAGIYYEMVFGNTSANLLEAYRNTLPDRPDFAALDRLAEAVAPGANGVRLRPDADAARIADSLVGLESHHTAGHVARAIMEGVAFALAEQVDGLCGSDRPPEIRSSGGAARSDVWLAIKADVLGTPFVASVCPEPTSLGAAMLAAKAVGWGDLQSLTRHWVRTRPPHVPDPQRHLTYRTMRQGRRG